MTLREMLTQIDVLAEHVGKSITRLDNQADEIAHQRMDLVMTQQHVENLRRQVVAVVLQAERVVTSERRHMDTHELAARVSAGAARKAKAALTVGAA